MDVTDPQGYDTTVAVYNLDTAKKPTPACSRSILRITRPRRLSLCPGRGAAFFMPLRRAGTVQAPVCVTAPALQRTARALRCDPAQCLPPRPPSFLFTDCAEFASIFGYRPSPPPTSWLKLCTSSRIDCTAQQFAEIDAADAGQQAVGFGKAKIHRLTPDSGAPHHASIFSPLTRKLRGKRLEFQQHVFQIGLIVRDHLSHCAAPL